MRAAARAEDIACQPSDGIQQSVRGYQFTKRHQSDADSIWFPSSQRRRRRRGRPMGNNFPRRLARESSRPSKRDSLIINPCHFLASCIHICILVVVQQSPHIHVPIERVVALSVRERERESNLYLLMTIRPKEREREEGFRGASERNLCSDNFPSMSFSFHSCCCCCCSRN